MKPVSIVSPTGKSGTNFLSNMLKTVGLCESPAKEVLAREDHLVFHSALLLDYVRETASIWRIWEKNEQIIKKRSNELLRCLGEGITNFIIDANNGILPALIKTPSSRGINNFSKLFSGSKLILLVRDGRDTTESAVKAGYWPDYESAFEAWSIGARSLVDYMGSSVNAEGISWILVTYESLVTDSTATVKQIAEFLGADFNNLQIERANHLPVYGSSQSAQT
jgi:hypothetical protein